MTTERANTMNALTNIAVIIAIVGGAWTLSGSMARLQAGVDGNAAAILKLQEAVAENGKAIADNRAAIADNRAAIGRLSGQLEEHIRRNGVPAAS